MKNRILSLVRSSIPYVKELRKITGSVTATILMQQLDYWFERHPDGFYKFMEECSNNPRYKKGASWSEELGFSRSEFTTAFDAIGMRYKSKAEFEASADKFQGRFYASYFDKVKGLTFYFRNHLAADKALDSLCGNNTNIREIKNVNLPTPGDEESSSPGDKESSSPVYIEPYTTNTNKNPPYPPEGGTAATRPAGGENKNATRGTRIDPNYQPAPSIYAWCAKKFPSITTAELADRVEEFVDHYTAKAGARAFMKDWDAAFRGWVRTYVLRHRSRPGQAASEPLRRVVDPGCSFCNSSEVDALPCPAHGQNSAAKNNHGKGLQDPSREIVSHPSESVS